MSLFQARDWWRSPTGASEEHDSGGLLVANVDNADDGADKVVVGSLSGTLRIFAPSAAGDSSEHADALLLEEHLGASIVQLGFGRFQQSAALLPSTAARNTLAVLHPTRLVVYSVARADAPVAGAAAALALTRVYEVAFGANFSACNMVWGSMGAGVAAAHAVVSGSGLFDARAASPAHRDAIAVQSLDGQLALVEHGVLVFRRQLSGVLLPGPLVYCPQSDSIVTAGSDLGLHAWRYATLAGAGGGGGSAAVATAAVGGGGPPSTSASVKPDWSWNVGDFCPFLLRGRLLSRGALGGASDSCAAGLLSAADASPESSNQLIAVCDHSISVLKEGGPAGAASAASAAASAAISAALGSAAASSSFPGGQQSLTNPLLLHRRTDFSAVSVCLVERPADAGGSGAALGTAETQHNLLIATAGSTHHSPQLRVYRGDALVWSARLPFAPVAMAAGAYGGTPGLLTLLARTGELAVCYMGTDPPLDAAGASLTGGQAGAASRELDVRGTESELKRLGARIKAAQAAAAQAAAGSGDSSGASALVDRLSLHLEMAAVVDAAPAGRGMGAVPAVGGESKEGGDDDPTLVPFVPDRPLSEEEWEPEPPAPGAVGPTPTLTVRVRLSFEQGPASAVSAAYGIVLSVAAPPWVRLPRGRRTLQLGDLPAGCTLALALPFRCSRFGVPSDPTVVLTATYHTSPLPSAAAGGGPAGGAPSVPSRVSVLSFPLPLACVCLPVPPVKADGAVKLTLETNREAVPPAVLFSDLLAASTPPHFLPADARARIVTAAASVLSLRLHCGADVTLLVSKAAGRYRLQAGSWEALALVADSLAARLVAHWALMPAHAGAPPFALGLAQSLPLQPVLAAVDDHIAARRALRNASAQLGDRAHEYRLVVKRLLTRFKDRTPAPLGGLDELLEAAAAHVWSAGRAVAAAHEGVAAAANRLAALVLLLLTTLHARHQCLQGADGAPAMAALRASFPVAPGYGGLPSIPSDALPAGAEEATGQAASGAAVGWEETAEAALAALLRSKQPPFAPSDASSAAASSAAAAAAASGSASVGPLPESSCRLQRLLEVLHTRLAAGTAAAGSDRR